MKEIKRISSVASSRVKDDLYETKLGISIADMEIEGFDGDSLIVKMVMKDRSQESVMTFEGKLKITDDKLRIYLQEDVVIQEYREREIEFSKFFSSPIWAFHNNINMRVELVIQAIANYNDGIENPCLEALRILPENLSLSPYR